MIEKAMERGFGRWLVGAALVAGPAAAQCEIERLVARQAQAGDLGGSAMDVSEDLLAVGAPGAAPAGAVDLFRACGGQWVHAARIEGFQAGSRFGAAVALDHLGGAPLLAVGAPDDTPAGGPATGMVYVFGYDSASDTWGLAVDLSTAFPGPQAGDRIGSSVDIAGATLAVGAEGVRTGNMFEAGAAYVIENLAAVPPLAAATIQPDAPVTGALFGHSIAFEDEDGTLVVGAWYEDAGNKIQAGAAYVFEDCNGLWTQLQRLTAPMLRNFQHYGASVGIGTHSLDGCGPLVVVVGAAGDLGGGVSSAGATHVYCGDPDCGAPGASPLVLRDTLTAAQPKVGDRFGESIDYDDDALVVGAPRGDGPGLAGMDIGLAFRFDFVGSAWSASPPLLSKVSQPGQLLGSAVALPGTAFLPGARVLAGAPMFDFGLAGDTGLVSFFKTNPCGTIGINYCQGALNSTGRRAGISAHGSSIADNQNVELRAVCCPDNAVGLFYFGPNRLQGPPFGFGRRCVAVGGSQRIYPFSKAGPMNGNPAGEARLVADFNLPYATSFFSGASLNFQFWYRDTQGGTSGFNLTDGINIEFQ